MKLFRTIRFDQSDTHVFETAAPPDEWAVPGGFAFAGLAPQAVTGKLRQTFANGFLGIPSFGRSTFVTVGEITPAERERVASYLAAHLLDIYGAPDPATARAAAEEELGFAEDMCRDVLINTVFTLRRRFDETAAIREEFRTIRPPDGEPIHTKVWIIEPDDT